MIRTLARHWAAFRREKSGTVAIIFGISAIPVTLAMGAAIDYSLANRAKTSLDGYADAAALAAVSKNFMSLPPAAARYRAENLFRAQAASLKRGGDVMVAAAITEGTTQRTVVVTYSAEVPTSFMGLVSISSIKVTGTASATGGLPQMQQVRVMTPDGVKVRTMMQAGQMGHLTK